MAGKSSGMGSQLWVAGYSLGGSTNGLSRISGGPAPIDLTDITQSAYERKGGKRDGGMTVVSYFNADAGASHAIYSTLPTADVAATYSLGSTIGALSASTLAKQIGYDGSRGDDGQFLLTVDAQANGFGLQWGFMTTPGARTDAAATAAAAVSPLDQLSATPGAFGLVMYVHLISLGSGSVTIKIQSSSDNAGDAYSDVTGATTAALSSAPTAVRVATAAIDIERYLKVVTTGSFTNAVFAVQAYRHRVQTDY